MNKYGLHGKLVASEGNVDKLADILLRASEIVGTAKGCQLYMVSRDQTNENAVWVTEIWEAKEDHDFSLTIPGVGALISEALPILEGTPQKGQELEILGGSGVN